MNNRWLEVNKDNLPLETLKSDFQTMMETQETGAHVVLLISEKARIDNNSPFITRGVLVRKNGELMFSLDPAATSYYAGLENFSHWIREEDFTEVEDGLNKEQSIAILEALGNGSK